MFATPPPPPGFIDPIIRFMNISLIPDQMKIGVSISIIHLPGAQQPKHFASKVGD